MNVALRVILIRPCDAGIVATVAVPETLLTNTIGLNAVTLAVWTRIVAVTHHSKQGKGDFSIQDDTPDSLDRPWPEPPVSVVATLLAASRLSSLPTAHPEFVAAIPAGSSANLSHANEFCYQKG